MAFETFKNRSPECGKQIKHRRSETGSFRYPMCGCEYARNWKGRACAGGPIVGLLLWMI